jgi:hypothetical protein
MRLVYETLRWRIPAYDMMERLITLSVRTTQVATTNPPWRIFDLRDAAMQTPHYDAEPHGGGPANDIEESVLAKRVIDRTPHPEPPPPYEFGFLDRASLVASRRTTARRVSIAFRPKPILRRSAAHDISGGPYSRTREITRWRPIVIISVMVGGLCVANDFPGWRPVVQCPGNT